MSERRNFDSPEDDLDFVERVMVIEEVLGDRLQGLTRDEQARLFRKTFIDAFGDAGDLDEDTLASVIRNIRSRGPRL